MLNALEQSLVNAGYYRCPNDICFGVEGTGWYAGSAGKPCPPLFCDIRVRGDHYAVCDSYKPERAPLMTCTTLPELLAWMTEHGRVSEPGLPAYSNGWD